MQPAVSQNPLQPAKALQAALQLGSLQSVPTLELIINY